MYFSFSDLNFNSVVIDNVGMLPSIENLLGFEAHAVFSSGECRNIRDCCIFKVNDLEVFL